MAHSPSSRHFLDHDGSAPMRPEVREAVAAALEAGPPNPTGIHAASRAARALLERARRSVAAFLDVDPAGVLYTGSGIEALVAAVRGPFAAGGRLVATAGERPETMELLEQLAEEGWHVTKIGLDAAGRVEVDRFADALEGADLALLHHANHETGVLQPVEEAARACEAHSVPLVVDATWSFGRAALARRPGPAAMAVSFHRAGGPAGIGALWARSGFLRRPLVPGAGERGRRGGVEPVALAAGAAALVGAFERAGVGERRRVEGLRDEMENRLLEAIPGARRNGGGRRLPGTSNLSFPGLEAEALGLRLDLEGFAVSVGAACSAGSSEPGHVLPAMGLPEEVVRSAVRLSLGWSTRREAVEALAARLPGLVEDLRAAHPAAARTARP